MTPFRIICSAAAGFLAMLAAAQATAVYTADAEASATYMGASSVTGADVSAVVDIMLVTPASSTSLDESFGDTDFDANTAIAPMGLLAVGDTALVSATTSGTAFSPAASSIATAAAASAVLQIVNTADFDVTVDFTLAAITSGTALIDALGEGANAEASASISGAMTLSDSAASVMAQAAGVLDSAGGASMSTLSFLVAANSTLLLTLDAIVSGAAFTSEIPPPAAFLLFPLGLILLIRRRRA